MLEDYYFYEVPAKPGARALLEFLRERGVAAAAATSSPRTHVTRGAGAAGAAGISAPGFHHRRGGAQQDTIRTFTCWQRRHWPRRRGRPLVFEDSLYALETARAAGFRAVGVFDAEGERDQSALRRDARLYLRTLEEFPAHWAELEN